MYVIYIYLYAEKIPKFLCFNKDTNEFYWDNDLLNIYVFDNVENAFIKYNEFKNKICFDNNFVAGIFLKKVIVENIEKDVIYKN